MKLFDKQYVYFSWSEELEDKPCFAASSINDLEKSVERHDGTFFGLVRKSNNVDYPFDLIGTDMDFVFVYYDPRYEYKKAFIEGKGVQFQWEGKDHWTDVTEEGQLTLENINLRLKPKEYRPFKDCAELFEHWNKVLCPHVQPLNTMPLIWVKSNKDCPGIEGELITGFPNAGEVLINGTIYSMQQLFSEYSFLDGSVIGILED